MTIAAVLAGATLPSLTPAFSSPPSDLAVASGSSGTSQVTVSWRWSPDALAYRIQVSKHSDFSEPMLMKKVRSVAPRPRGGRQVITIHHLQDATYYWVRVRQAGGDQHSRADWSTPYRVATKARWPARITRVSSTRGPLPGETTIRWSSAGKNTDSFRIETALTPFSHQNPSVPDQGWEAAHFVVPGNRRSLTLTAAQTAAAGAGLGTGRHLLFRIYAIRKGNADSRMRSYAHMMSATVAGEGPTTTGTPIRVANYNVRMAPADAGTSHTWADRTDLIVQNLRRQHPTIVGLEEMLPSMWTSEAGGPGLDTALQRGGLGQYHLTQATAWSKHSPGDARILYDSTRVQLVSRCSEAGPNSCFELPSKWHSPIAEWAEFQDKASGVHFLFVASHLDHGNDRADERMRGKQAEAIVQGIDRVNVGHLPVILAADLNSYQTCPGRNAPHRVLLHAGFYDTSAAAHQVNLQYGTVNHYSAHEKPSALGFGARLDVVMTRGMPGAQTFKNVRTGQPYPSDHNLVWADLRLPAA